MNITLYTCNSPENSLTKNLTERFDFTGTMRESTTVTDPEILISGNVSLSGVNYAFIPQFGRYYYIRNIDVVRNGVYKLLLHVDVLYTYRSQILRNSAIIERSETDYDLKLNDGLFVTAQNPRIATFNFPSGFSTYDLVLALAGN